jgi:hypothetical protein
MRQREIKETEEIEEIWGEERDEVVPVTRSRQCPHNRGRTQHGVDFTVTTITNTTAA